MSRRLLLACAFAALPAIVATPALATCPSDEAISRLADAMAAGRLEDPFQGLSLAGAECAREKLVPLLERHWGRVVGYKAGLTSTAAQRSFGLSEPVHGSIFAMTLSIRDGGEVPVRFGAEASVRVEPDLVVRVRDEGINAAGRDRIAILRHIDQVIPFIELPVAAFRGNVDGLNLVAANVNARLGVVGRPLTLEATEEVVRRLGTMTVVFSDDTRELTRAPGSALLGHPLDVIPWLVEDLAKHGRRLQAGDIVSLGGFAPSAPAQPGRTYTLRYEGLLDEPVSVAVRLR